MNHSLPRLPSHRRNDVDDDGDDGMVMVMAMAVVMAKFMVIKEVQDFDSAELMQIGAEASGVKAEVAHSIIYERTFSPGQDVPLEDAAWASITDGWVAC